jgi:hypothetical protein
MQVPEGMPVLSGGSHSSPRLGACVMEYCSLLAGEEWTDRPTCTNEVIAHTAQRINDTLWTKDRQLLVRLIPRLIGTAGETLDDEMRINMLVREVLYTAVYTDVDTYLRVVSRGAEGEAEAHHIAEQWVAMLERMCDVADAYNHVDRSAQEPVDLSALQERMRQAAGA